MSHEMMDGELARHPDLLSVPRSRLAIIDVQERLLPAMHAAEICEARCRRLVDAAGLFDVPVSATEQAPEKLGPTVAGLAEALPSPTSKLSFSACEVLELGPCEAPAARDQIILCGIETHVCVLQTAFDLLSAGWRPYVVADAVTSRSPADHDRALARMEAAGAVVVTSEMVLFEWAVRAGTDEFRAVSKLVR